MFKSPAISGCHVERLGAYVRKSTNDELYYERLQKQMQKQMWYFRVLKTYGIRVPRVIEYGENWFSMEYVPGIGYVEFVETFPAEEVKTLLGRVLTFVRDSLSEMQWNSLSQINMQLVEKEMSKPTFPRGYEKIGHRILQETQYRSLPRGRCHGDLTFSNLLFANGEIALLDFNDVPFESPLLDVFKLKQELKYGWTSYLTKRRHDRTKVALVNRMLLQRLEGMLRDMHIDLKEFTYWEALNYFRILRNTNGDAEFRNYVVQCIEETLCQR